MSERGLSPMTGHSPLRQAYAGACERTYSM
jgi:hypothetical protein